MKIIQRLFNKKKHTYENYFNFFENLYSISCKMAYWIKPFPGIQNRYIISQFKQQRFLRYNGLELVILDNHTVTYHRLPGAKPSGRGYVENGQHCIKLHSMQDDTLQHFEVTKNQHRDVNILSISKSPTEGKDYHYLPKNILVSELFAPELIENILLMLNWHYSCHLSNFSYDVNNLKSIVNSVSQHTIDDSRVTLLTHRIKHEMLY